MCSEQSQEMGYWRVKHESVVSLVRGSGVENTPNKYLLNELV